MDNIREHGLMVIGREHNGFDWDRISRVTSSPHVYSIVITPTSVKNFTKYMQVLAATLVQITNHMENSPSHNMTKFFIESVKNIAELISDKKILFEKQVWIFDGPNYSQSHASILITTSEQMPANEKVDIRFFKNGCDKTDSIIEAIKKH